MNGENFVEFLALVYVARWVPLGFILIMGVLYLCMRSPKTTETLDYRSLGEHLGNEDNLEDLRENPAPADSMTEIPRMEPTIRRRKPSPAPLPQNPRLHLVATIAEKDGHLAHFTTKRRVPRTGQVERYRSQDCAVMVNDSGNRHWVRP